MVVCMGAATHAHSVALYMPQSSHIPSAHLTVSPPAGGSEHAGRSQAPEPRAVPTRAAQQQQGQEAGQQLAPLDAQHPSAAAQCQQLCRQWEQQHTRHTQQQR